MDKFYNLGTLPTAKEASAESIDKYNKWLDNYTKRENTNCIKKIMDSIANGKQKADCTYMGPQLRKELEEKGYNVIVNGYGTEYIFHVNWK